MRANCFDVWSALVLVSIVRLLPRCMECRRGLAMRFLSVRLPVLLSVCQTRALLQTGKICPDFIPCERSLCLVLNGWWAATPSIWNFGSIGPRWSEIADFEPIIARSASAVRPSEKSSINTNGKSPTRVPTSLRWSLYVAPKSPKEGFKTQNGRFSSIIELRLKNVCYKVSLCENCQRQSYRAFIGLTIHAKIIVGRRPLLLEILGQPARVERNRRFSIYFRS